MSSLNGLNNQQLKEQQQYLNMRGAQIAMNQAGQEQKLTPPPKVRGNRRQLIGTIAIIAGAFLAIAILSWLGIL
ncbi:MAG: hypothetical protein PUC06_09210 [Oscillospiraceae bacterium]|nr:hypothetical protein [Oscillospiraceae bacterium]